MGHVTLLLEMRNAYKFPSENLKGRDLFEDAFMDGSIILKCALKK
jgi:hypothetical protein